MVMGRLNDIMIIHEIRLRKIYNFSIKSIAQNAKYHLIRQ